MELIDRVRRIVHPKLVCFSILAAFAAASALAQPSTLMVAPTMLTFTAASGGAPAPTQTIAANATTTPLPVALVVRYLSPVDGWLSIAPDSGTTSLTVTVSADPKGLAPATYQAQIVATSGTTQSVIVTVNFTVTPAGSGGGGVLTASPSTITLTASTGTLVTSAVNVGSSAPTSFNVFVSTASGGSWLASSALSSIAPTTLTISGNPIGLANGTYNGTVTLSPSSGGPSTSIPVTFIVGSGGTSGFSATPSSLSFLFQTGTSTPASQQVYINNSTGLVGYTAATLTPWLRLTSNNNPTPAPTVTGQTNTYLNVFVDPSGLSLGTYGGTIRVTGGNGLLQDVSVSLTVSGTSLFSATPSSLTFTYSPSVGLPASQQTTITSTGTAVSFSVTTTSSGWLTAFPLNGTTNSSNVITVSVNPGSLIPGPYAGTVNVAGPGVSLTIPVSFTVGSSTLNSIVATPQALTFNGPLGGPASTQTINLTSRTSMNFNASATPGSSSWLSVNPSFGSTPATLMVTANPAGFSTPGNYDGSILISNLTDSTQLSLPVRYVVSGTLLTASPSQLMFSQSAGGAAPVAQSFQISGPGNSSYTATANASWITLSPLAGSVPGTVTVSINGAMLAPGSYQGAISVVGQTNAATVTVNLTVTASAAPTLSLTNLTFNFVTGGAVPGQQSVAVGSSGPPLNFSVSAATTSGGNWLSVTSNAPTTPAILTVGAITGGLAPGTYRGTVTVTSASGTESRAIDVTLTITGAAAPVLRSVVHGATLLGTRISPGLILSILGSGLGPVNGLIAGVSSAGAIDSTLGGVRVFFDGVAAPLLFVRQDQINAIAPYALYGRVATRVQVEVNGVRSETLELSVVDTAPGLFTIDGTGRGQLAALNEDGRVNGPANPAAAGSIIVLYATGEGQTAPPGQDGRIIANDLRRPLQAVSVTIGGVPVEVLYAGSAPGLVSGALQINVRLSQAVPRGNTIPVEMSVGLGFAQGAISVAIQ